MRKLFAMLFAGAMALGLFASFSPARLAFADSGRENHGHQVSRVAHSAPHGEGEDHGQTVSNVARASSTSTLSIHVNDEGENENENENEGGEDRVATSTNPNQGNADLIRRLEAFIASLEARLRALLGGQAVAPVISSVTVSNVGTSTATVAWTSNVGASSKVYYRTTTPVNAASSSAVSDAALVTSHSMNLTGLAASSTYYFVVESTDSASTTVRSAEMSFTTLSSASPVITNVGMKNITSSSALISWTTDVSATSRVYFTTNATVGTSTAPWVASPALTVNHAMALGGLAASSTYYFVVESADGSGTVTDAPQASFTTSH